MAPPTRLSTTRSTARRTGAVPATKRSLLVLSHAMERAFDAPVDLREPGLVIGLFQRREHFDVEAERYAALASSGHTVLVGFAGSTEGLPPGVHAVAFAEDSPLARAWVLVLVRGPYATSLDAEDQRDLAAGEGTFEASRLFEATWTFRRNVALGAAAHWLAQVAPSLPGSVVASAQRLIRASAELAVSPVEERLAAAADHLMTSVDAGQRRSNALRTALSGAQELAERDQLTGLSNRHFLERYLGGADRPADLVVLLVDVDDLKTANDRHGHAAGDAVLHTVADTLRRQCRPGDVVVRWGGDEFLILAPDLDEASGLAMGQRLAEAVQATHPGTPWQHLSLSVSVGVCTTRRTILPLDRLDEALYRVKQAGKGHAALAV